MTPLDQLRALCLELPETTEKVSHGEPTWFVRKRTFVMFANHHHDDRVGFWCAAPPGAQEAMVDGKRYFRPPYVGHRGWLGVYLDVPVDWDELAEVVEDAYRVIAPNKLKPARESLYEVQTDEQLPKGNETKPSHQPRRKPNLSRNATHTVNPGEAD